MPTGLARSAGVSKASSPRSARDGSHSSSPRRRSSSRASRTRSTGRRRPGRRSRSSRPSRSASVSSAGNGLSTQASLSDRIASPRPPHRLERLKELMAEGQLDGVVALGADHATHLAGYSRYNGGPCAVVVDRTGERTLVVMGAEVESAEAGSEAETVRRFGGPDIPLVLDFAPLLATGVASLPRIAGARRLGFADGLGGIEAELSRELAAELVPMEEPLDELRAVKDEDELGRILRAYELCWIAQREVGRAAAAGETEIGAFSAAHAAAQVAHERPIEFNSDLLSGA